MKIAVVGGTGKEGSGLAMRWARAGHEVTIGSRDAVRAKEKAAEMSAACGSTLHGDANEGAVANAEIVILSIPYPAHSATLKELASALQGKIAVDITVPLQPPMVREVHPPAGQAAALEAKEILGDGVRLVAGMHHVSAAHLADFDHVIDCDVLVVSDDQEAKEITMGIVRDLPMRPIDAGVLRNAIALESLTPVLLSINKTYKAPGAGLRITNVE